MGPDPVVLPRTGYPLAMHPASPAVSRREPPAGRWYALSASTKGGKTTRPRTPQTIPAVPCPTRTGSLPASGSDKLWKLKHGPPGAIDADLKTVTDRILTMIGGLTQ